MPSLLQALLLAVGLAMDATAAAAARGIAARRVRVVDALVVALAFGGAQAVMPLLGWWLGAALGPAIAAFDHWVAFVLLVGIGLHMLWEALRTDVHPPADEVHTADRAFAPRTILVLAVATSIDAFAAGITLPLVGLPVLLSASLIGFVTAAASFAGVYAGRRFGALLERRLEIVGAVILMGLGVKVLVEHLSA